MRMATKLHAILSKFRNDKPEWRQSDLARALDVSPSALSRSLATMADLGFIRFNPDVGTYSLGPAIVALAGTAINQYEEFRHAYTEMHALMSQTHLGTNLGILDDQSVMYLMHIDGPKMQRSITLIGRHVPLHCTALGKVILAGIQEQEAAALVGTPPLDSYTVNTITSIERLLAEIAVVRSRGYAVELEELGLGRACIAAPIRDRDGRVAAALSLSGPKDAIRLTDNEDYYAGLLLDVTDRISGKLGYIAGANPRPAVVEAGRAVEAEERRKPH
jgi:DNA-binding IclR family transcriptional regulator